MRKRELERAVRAHATWIASRAQQGVRADLRGHRLPAVDLAGADLRGAILCDTFWTTARLAGARLTGALLNRADLRDADLRGADLTAVDLRDARLDGSDLRGAIFAVRVGYNELDVPRASHHANLAGASLGGAQLDHAALEGTGAFSRAGEQALGPHDSPIAPPLHAPLERAPVERAPAIVLSTAPAAPIGWRSPDRLSVIAVAKRVIEALGDLPSVDDAIWTWEPSGESYDAYETSVVEDGAARLTLQLTHYYSDSIAGPRPNGTSAGIHATPRSGLAFSLRWTDPSSIVLTCDEPSTRARLVAAGVAIAGS